eukprot:3939417-Rhodomonas_salina.2
MKQVRAAGVFVLWDRHVLVAHGYGRMYEFGLSSVIVFDLFWNHVNMSSVSGSNGAGTLFGLLSNQERNNKSYVSKLKHVFGVDDAGVLVTPRMHGVSGGAVYCVCGCGTELIRKRCRGRAGVRFVQDHFSFRGGGSVGVGAVRCQVSDFCGKRLRILSATQLIADHFEAIKFEGASCRGLGLWGCLKRVLVTFRRSDGWRCEFEVGEGKDVILKICNDCSGDVWVVDIFHGAGCKRTGFVCGGGGSSFILRCDAEEVIRAFHGRDLCGLGFGSIFLANCGVCQDDYYYYCDQCMARLWWEDASDGWGCVMAWESFLGDAHVCAWYSETFCAFEERESAEAGRICVAAGCTLEQRLGSRFGDVKRQRISCGVGGQMCKCRDCGDWVNVMDCIIVKSGDCSVGGGSFSPRLYACRGCTTTCYVCGQRFGLSDAAVHG